MIENEDDGMNRETHDALLKQQRVHAERRKFHEATLVALEDRYQSQGRLKHVNGTCGCNKPKPETHTIRDGDGGALLKTHNGHFKRRMVKLCEGDWTPRGVAQQFGCSESRVVEWISLAEAGEPLIGDEELIKIDLHARAKAFKEKQIAEAEPRHAIQVWEDEWLASIQIGAITRKQHVHAQPNAEEDSAYFRSLLDTEESSFLLKPVDWQQILWEMSPEEVDDSLRSLIDKAPITY